MGLNGKGGRRGQFGRTTLQNQDKTGGSSRGGKWQSFSYFDQPLSMPPIGLVTMFTDNPHPWADQPLLEVSTFPFPPFPVPGHSICLYYVSHYRPGSTSERPVPYGPCEKSPNLSWGVVPKGHGLVFITWPTVPIIMCGVLYYSIHPENSRSGEFSPG
jgi:hypothetical protein